MSAPDSADLEWPETLKEAASAAAAGDREDAERLYRKVLAARPDHVEALMGLGAALAEPARKAECFRQVLRADPAHSGARRALDRLGLPAEEATPAALVCAFHPKRETLLRCSQCDRPICPKCAQPHVVGHLCKVCVSGRRARGRSTHAGHFAAAGLATGAAAAAVGLIAGSWLAWNFLLAFFAGPAVGSLLARVALWSGRGRSGRPMQVMVGASIVAGTLLGAGWLHARVFEHGDPGGFLFDGGAIVLYLVLAIGSAVAWLR